MPQLLYTPALWATDTRQMVCTHLSYAAAEGPDPFPEEPEILNPGGVSEGH